MLWLDAQNRLIAAEELFRGTLTQTSVHPREVVKRALAHNAAAVIWRTTILPELPSPRPPTGVDAGPEGGAGLGRRPVARSLHRRRQRATAVAGRAGPPVSAYARPAGLATLSGAFVLAASSAACERAMRGGGGKVATLPALPATLQQARRCACIRCAAQTGR